MAHPLRALPGIRPCQLRLGIGIECVTICWMIVEAAVALIVGFTAHSVSFLMKEGREARNFARRGETCSCGDEDGCDA